MSLRDFRPPDQLELRRREAPTWRQRPASAVKILRWNPVPNAAGTMLGSLDVELPSGLVINAAKLMSGPNGQYWVATPSVRRRDKDDQPVTGEDGKPLYDQIVGFRDRSARDRFRDQVLDALRRVHPEAFGDAA